MNEYQYNKNDVSIAKSYMNEYKFLVDIHKLNIGFIGRFFEKLFGTSVYTNIEAELERKYNLTYYRVIKVLYYTNNDKYIYDPFNILNNE